MTDKNPLVSVIITTYNRKEKIRAAIDSVLNQSYRNIEIIVVDDNSDYHITDHLSTYSDQITLLVNGENRGANWSRTRGIKCANGKYISFLDDDDQWKVNKVDKQIQKFKQSSPSVGLVTVGIEQTSGNYVIPPQINNKDITKTLLTGDNIIGSFSVIMVEQSVIDLAGPPDPSLSSSQDLEWYIRLSEECDFEVVQEPLTIYDSDGDDRISETKLSNYDDSFGYILSKHSDIMDRYDSRTQKYMFSERHFRLAWFAANKRDYTRCRTESIAAIKLYPYRLSAYALLFVSFTRYPGYKLVSILYNRLIH